MRSSRLLSTAFAVHSSFLESIIVSKYEGFILDQYGVLHNGREALPGAIEAVKELISQNKKLVILSNTSSPAKSALEKLRKLGFSPEWFEAGAVTSGEEASAYIAKTYGADKQKKKAVWLTYSGSEFTPPPLDFIEKCGNIEMAKSVDEADFVIAHGGEVWYQGDWQQVDLDGFMSSGSFGVLGPILEACQKRDLPLVCANPDFIVRMADNTIAHMPGKIGEFYEKLGGNAAFFGKPHEEHFHACLQQLGLDRDKVAHVGDSLHHDIAGAVGAGIDSVFVTSGIHSDELKSAFGVMPSKTDLESLFEKEQITPTHVVAAFI
jgi:HAD superfamily hydrolase (TIGR01459 family)